MSTQTLSTIAVLAGILICPGGSGLAGERVAMLAVRCTPRISWRSAQDDDLPSCFNWPGSVLSTTRPITERCSSAFIILTTEDPPFSGGPTASRAATRAFTSRRAARLTSPSLANPVVACHKEQGESMIRAFAGEISDQSSHASSWEFSPQKHSSAAPFLREGAGGRTP